MKLLTPHEVAEMTGIAENTLRNWRSQRVHLPWRKVGRMVRYDLADVQSWIQRQPRQLPSVSALTEESNVRH